MSSHPVVHLELHTPELARACDFYAQVCGWRAELVDSYQAFAGTGLSGGAVECPAPRSLWLPYVEVERIGEATARARSLGARVLLPPREGPAGWRSVVATPAAGEIAFWQPKR